MRLSFALLAVLISFFVSSPTPCWAFKPAPRYDFRITITNTHDHPDHEFHIKFGTHQGSLFLCGIDERHSAHFMGRESISQIRILAMPRGKEPERPLEREKNPDWLERQPIIGVHSASLKIDGFELEGNVTGHYQCDVRFVKGELIAVCHRESKTQTLVLIAALIGGVTAAFLVWRRFKSRFRKMAIDDGSFKQVPGGYSSA